MKKVIVKFSHTHAGKNYAAGSILELPAGTADWLLEQRIDDQPCAVLYTGKDRAVNAPEAPEKSI